MAKPKSEKREVLYTEIDVEKLIGDKALGYERAMFLVGWETEEEYKKRKGNKVEFGDDYLLKVGGIKVRCNNNSRNRPFDEGHCKSLAQDILFGNWCLNLETIIISRTGLVLSGQHRLLALILAYYEWKTNPMRYKLWKEAPTIECLLAVGCSEDQKVIQTLDNVKPRTLSDVVYTSGMFNDLSSPDRKEASRYLDNAVDLLWRRTGQARYEGNRYQTHSSSMGFLGRHPKLNESVRFLFDANRDRSLSSLKMSVGHMAALHYLMGCSTSTKEDYKESIKKNKNSLPDEKGLKWDNWDKVCEFFALIAAKSESVEPIRNLLGSLAGLESKEGNNTVEKICILVKAWNIYNLGGIIDEDRIRLVEGDEISIGSEGQRKLVNEPIIGGIDLGSTSDNAPTPMEISKLKEEEKKKALADKRKEGNKPASGSVSSSNGAGNKIEGTGEVSEGISAWLSKLKKLHPDKLFIFKKIDDDGVIDYDIWGSDALRAAKILGVNVSTKDAYKNVSINPDKLNEALAKFKKVNVAVGFCQVVDGDIRVINS